MKDLLKFVGNSGKYRNHTGSDSAVRKVRLSPVQKRVLELLTMYGEPAERDELLQPNQDRQVLSRMVKNALIRYEAYHRMYEITTMGSLALKDGFYFPVPKI